MKRERLIGLLLVAITLVAFWQVLGNGFIKFFDDGEYILQNHFVSDGLTKTGIVWAFTKSHSGNWHPLTWLSHMLDCQLYGLKPTGHHLTSLLFHIANILLLFLLLARMTGAVWRSAFVAALFAIHPLHVESVAWVAERKDMLSTFFWLLTMLAYVSYARHPGLGRYLLVVLFFTLGLMSKPMLVTLPIVLLLMDYWPLKRLVTQPPRSTLNTQHSTLNRLLIEKSPLFAMSAASSVITYIVQQKQGAMAVFEELPLGVRAGNAAVSYARYIGKMIWPDNLAIFYPHAMESLPLWQAVAAGLLFVSITVLVVRYGRDRQYLPVGWCWYVVTLVPVIGLVQVGMQSMADRYTYVPLIGLFIVVAWGVPDLLTRKADSRRGRSRRASEAPDRTKTLAWLGVLVIAALMARTWVQVRYWQYSITVFEHAIACTSGNSIAYGDLGLALLDEGRIAEAADRFAESLEINPDQHEAHSNLGICLYRLGKMDEAVKQYRMAIRIKPTYADAHYNLGNALLKLNRFDEAAASYRKALRLKPDDPDMHNNLANALIRQGKVEEAIPEYREVLRLKPDYPMAYFNLGYILGRQGKPGQAISYFEKGLRITPDDANAHFQLGLLLAKAGRIDEAARHYREALKIEPNHADARKSLREILSRS